MSIGLLGAAGLGYLLTGEEFGHPNLLELILAPATRPVAPLFDDPYQARFSICAGPIRTNCVVDGDTFWFEGIKIRIADIDAPEISNPVCTEEAQAGELAKARLLDLLNADRFRLIAGSHDEDRFGRKLRIVARDNASFGEVLVREGLARRWGDPDLGWCS
ncbi:thermonuclease family protein [Devosia sp. LjRoot3]|uniref:thermonuclease family protein n=1 Tax=Devosia sp. LjRoot3 TaxID=3342319 RepID=UPI003F4F5F60